MKEQNKNGKYLNVGIIAAGDGSRLKAEGVNISKPLIPVLGKPIIKWLIDAAVKLNASSIVCIVNEQSKDLERFLKSFPQSKKVKIIVKTTPSSFHSLAEISQFLKPPFLLATADSVFCEDEFSSFIEFGINATDADLIVASTDFIEDEKPLYINLDDDGNVISFEDWDNHYDLVTGGLYLFKKEIYNEIDEAINLNINRLRNFLRLLVNKNWKIQAYPFSKIIDVDHKSDIIKAEQLLNEQYKIKN
ncbi:MAG: sugar phosphate nucleotidyltransferase [Bacteroidota bacterium]